MTEDYDIENNECPKCKHNITHSRNCLEILCTDGFYEDFFDDLKIEGTGFMRECSECKGTGIERWCPNCGENLSGVHFEDDDYYENE